MATKEDPSAMIESITASNYPAIAFNLTYIKGLTYNESVSGVAKPRSVPEVWKEIVTLFTVSQDGLPSEESKQDKFSAGPNEREEFEEVQPDETQRLDESMRNADIHNTAEESTLAVPHLPDQVVIDNGVNQHVAMKTEAVKKIDHRYPPELQNLVDALLQEHTNETQFSIALFNALRGAFLKHKLVEACSPSLEPEKQFIVFKYGATDTQAIAIKRELNGEQKSATGIKQSAMFADKRRETSSGLVANTKLDHCPCLIERSQNGTLKFLNCFSVLKLKMDDANCCRAFDSSTNVHEQIELDGGHGSAAQVMMYSLGWVLPGLARIGQLGTEFPWTVVVGKRLRPVEMTKRAKTETEVSISNRWMSGNIYVPDECGDPYQYAVTGFGGRMNEVAALDSALDALSVYLETMLFGLKAAKACLDYQVEHDNRWPEPCPVSGKQVVISGHEIPSRLRSSATMGRFPNGGNDDCHWDAAQGELFTGKFNLAGFYQKLTTAQKIDFVVFDKTMAEVDRSVDRDVVIKVTSRALHNYLTNPRDNLKALTILSNFSLNVSAISKVLYAVHAKDPIGVITIMADLSLKNYKVLRPQYCGAPVIDLWMAFEVVVNSVLLPMADFEVIHADIRPGWDVTSNILCKVDDSNSVVMQLIDYESVVSLQIGFVPPRITGTLNVTQNGTRSRICGGSAPIWRTPGTGGFVR